MMKDHRFIDICNLHLKRTAVVRLFFLIVEGRGIFFNLDYT
jgi:hypothetical protein